MNTTTDWSKGRYRARLSVRGICASLGLSIALAGTAAASSLPVQHPHLPLTSAAPTLAPNTSRTATNREHFPPTNSDAISAISIPSNASLGMLKEWITRAISTREVALFAAQNAVLSVHSLDPASKAFLLGVTRKAFSRLNAIASSTLSDVSTADALRQASAVIRLQILHVVSPQVRLLARVDVLLGVAGHLQAKEGSAAAAIAISQASSATVHSEQTLDLTIRSLVAVVIGALDATQHNLLVLTPADAAGDSATLIAAKQSIDQGSGQLRIINAHLRQLVAQLAGS